MKAINSWKRNQEQRRLPAGLAFSLPFSLSFHFRAISPSFSPRYLPFLAILAMFREGTVDGAATPRVDGDARDIDFRTLHTHHRYDAVAFHFFLFLSLSPSSFHPILSFRKIFIRISRFFFFVFNTFPLLSFFLSYSKYFSLFLFQGLSIFSSSPSNVCAYSLFFTYSHFSPLLLLARTQILVKPIRGSGFLDSSIGFHSS